MSGHRNDVVVIGAGLSGLTAAYVLRQHGFAPVILDREGGIGGTWQRRHPQLTLNTHRDLSTLPDTPYPPKTPAFPKRDAVVHHLQSFARDQAFDIRHGVHVTAIRREGSAWIVSWQDGALLARNVIIATGRDTEREIPAWPGLASFTGTLLHSHDLGDIRSYLGKSVLVIGGGNSGFDILNHLSRIKTGPVWLSVRRGPSLLPKRLFRFAVHRLSPVMQRLPTRLVDRLIGWTQWLAFGRLARLGFPHGADDAASRLIKEHVAIPVDDGAIAAVKRGQIRIVKAVRAFEGKHVLLEDGHALAPDIVLVATGFAASALSIVAEGGERTNAATPQPGLHFIGMAPSFTSYFMEARREATLIARRIRREDALAPR